MQPPGTNGDRGVRGDSSLDFVEFGIEVIHQGRGVLLRVRGEIDVATAPLLRAAADEALAGRPGQVHLHLGEVTFLDCAGLGVLIGLRNADALAAPVTTSGPVRRLIELAGASHLFDLQSPIPTVPSRSARECRCALGR